MDPVLEPVRYDTGRRVKGQPVFEPVWTPLMAWDEEKQDNVPVLDHNKQPVYFHKPDVRRKLLLLCRLLPLVMRNYHLAELGPKQTGKTYLLRNVSNSVYVVPGGKITSAQLIYSSAIGRERPGAIGNYRVVVFDDVGDTVEKGLGSSMRDFMESGVLSRGNKQTQSDCSLFFSANIQIAPDGNGPMFPNQSWFRVLPDEFGDTAIIDRLAACIPGWDLPKITDEGLTKGVGFLAAWPRDEPVARLTAASVRC